MLVMPILGRNFSESRADARQGKMAGRIFVAFAASHFSGVQVHSYPLHAQGGSLAKSTSSGRSPVSAIGINNIRAARTERVARMIHAIYVILEGYI